MVNHTMQRAFWSGALVGVIASALAGLFLIPVLGLFPMSVTGKTGFLDWWGHTNWKSSLYWRSTSASIPADASATKGLDHFAEMCIDCHGAPGVEGEDWAEHMQPRPPDLSERRTQDLSDGELFHVIRGGVRMTAMPAFGAIHSEKDLWNLVAFVRRMDNLSDAERSSLAAHHRKEHESEHDRGEGGE